MQEQPKAVPPTAAQHSSALTFRSTPLLSQLCFACTCPCAFCQSWITLNEGEQQIVLNTGHLIAEVTEPGCHFFNCCNREIRTISKKKRCLSIEKCKLAERNGNPMMVSAIVVFQVVTPHKALMQVTSFDSYMRTQALAILRQVITQFPFESHDDTPCLLHDSAVVNRDLAAQLNHLVNEMGVHVSSFCLDELSFAPEIASSMLQRQAAQALVDARQVIVHGASELAAGAVAVLAARGVKLTPPQRTKLIGNLLPVLCASERDGGEYH